MAAAESNAMNSIKTILIKPFRCFFTAGLLALAFTMTLPQTGHAGLLYSDEDFIKTAAMGGMAEVALSKLAIERATDPKVKSFASMMVTDHTKLNSEVKALAAKKNVTLPAELDKKHQEKVDELSKESGKDFDKDYLACMAKDHKKTLSLFEDAEDDTKDPNVKKTAANAIQVIKSHMAHLDEINKQSS
jgi:putative membrane protein